MLDLRHPFDEQVEAKINVEPMTNFREITFGDVCPFVAIRFPSAISR